MITIEIEVGRLIIRIIWSITNKQRISATSWSSVWLQSEERRGRFQNWEDLVKAVLSKYDQDQYPMQLRHLDSLKQMGSVYDYQTRFEELAHGILLYNPAYDDTFFVTRFLGGLKEEIRSAIALHRSKTVQIASELASLQEMELEL